MTETQSRWAAGVLWVLATFAFCFGIGFHRCNCGRDTWREALLLSGTALVAIAVLILVRQIRIETSTSAVPWRNTPTFGFAKLQLAVLAVSTFVGFNVAYAAAKLGHTREDVLAIETAILCLLLGLFSAIEIAAVDWVHKGDGELIYGGRDFSGADAWCASRLGVWWIARFVPALLLALFGLWVQRPFAFFYPTAAFGWRAYVHFAHAMNWNWPGKGKFRERLAKRRALEASPEFQQLRARNLWLDIGAVVSMSASIGSLMAIWSYTKIYSDHDPNGLWMVLLLFGLMMTAPFGFIYIATLARGPSRLAEYEHYSGLNCGFDFKYCHSVFGIFGALTIVSLIGIAFTGHFHN